MARKTTRTTAAKTTPAAAPKTTLTPEALDAMTTAAVVDLVHGWVDGRLSFDRDSMAALTFEIRERGLSYFAPAPFGGFGG